MLVVPLFDKDEDTVYDVDRLPEVRAPDVKNVSSKSDISRLVGRARGPPLRALGGGVTITSRRSVETVTGDPLPTRARPKPNPGCACLARRSADSIFPARSIIEVV